MVPERRPKTSDQDIVAGAERHLPNASVRNQVVAHRRQAVLLFAPAPLLERP
jgi:hypothetical protein